MEVDHLRRLSLRRVSEDRRHILFHLGLPDGPMSTWAPDHTLDGPLDWRVVRQDDNGHLFVAAASSSECEAAHLVAEYEVGGHTQTSRHDGVELGKRDYIGRLSVKPRR